MRHGREWEWARGVALVGGEGGNDVKRTFHSLGWDLPVERSDAPGVGWIASHRWSIAKQSDGG